MDPLLTNEKHLGKLLNKIQLWCGVIIKLLKYSKETSFRAKPLWKFNISANSSFTNTTKFISAGYKSVLIKPSALGGGGGGRRVLNDPN